MVSDKNRPHNYRQPLGGISFIHDEAINQACLIFCDHIPSMLIKIYIDFSYICVYVWLTEAATYTLYFNILHG